MESGGVDTHKDLTYKKITIYVQYSSIY